VFLFVYGGSPRMPPGETLFCAVSALTTSPAVRDNDASASGRTHARMA
jgi:hypothetical protein